jgi:hypothetical protein
MSDCKFEFSFLNDNLVVLAGHRLSSFSFVNVMHVTKCNQHIEGDKLCASQTSLLLCC